MASADTDFKQRRRRVLAGGGLAAVLLYGGGAAVYDTRIESDLESRVPEALAEKAGAEGITAKFSGQDGTISCSQPVSDPAQIEAVALDVHGVNKIELADDCRVAATEPEPDPEPVEETVPETSVSDGANYESVADIVVGDPGYGQLAAHLGKSDLAGALADTEGGPFTVFAPSNDAFSAVPAEQLALIESDPSVRDQVLGYHVVQGNITLDDMTDGATFETVSGETLTVAGDGDAATISSSGAKITGGPIEAKNGSVYTIDTVMVPENLEATPDPATSGVVTAVLDAGKISLTGTVATEEDRNVLVEAAARKVGAENVTDSLVVAEGGVTGDDAGSVGQLILGMGEQLVSGEAGMGTDGLYVKGFYADEAGKEGMLSVAALLQANTDLQPRPNADAETAEDLEAQLNAYVAENPILFESGSATLTAESNAVIDQLAAGLQQLSGLSVVVQGHTDSDGDEAANQSLSEQRAAAVAKALAERGVPAETITSEGFGESQLIEVDGTEDKAASRRVVFALTANQ